MQIDSVDQLADDREGKFNVTFPLRGVFRQLFFGGLQGADQ